jgi:hypothetical protein
MTVRGVTYFCDVTCNLIPELSVLTAFSTSIRFHFETFVIKIHYEK